MGTFLAVNGSLFVLLGLIGVALVAFLASRCSGYLIRKVRQFFNAAKARPSTPVRSNHANVAT